MALEIGALLDQDQRAEHEYASYCQRCQQYQAPVLRVNRTLQRRDRFAHPAPTLGV